MHAKLAVITHIRGGTARLSWH